MTEWEAAAWQGIGYCWGGGNDGGLKPLPAAGTPEREASDAEHRAMCEGLIRQFERARGAGK